MRSTAPAQAVSGEELLRTEASTSEQRVRRRQVRRETVRESLQQALEIGFERWARVWICAVILLMLGFLGLLIWSEMVFDVHRHKHCDMPLAKLLQALYIVVAIHIFREDIIRCIFCYNRERDGDEPCHIRIFRRLTLLAVLLWPVVGLVMLCMTHDCERQLQSAVTALVVYYVVVAVVTVVIPACFISVMLILVRRGLVRMPRAANAAPEDLADSLPKVRWEPALFNDEDDGFPAQCSICFEDFDDKLPITQTPCPCRSHAFHTECLKGWLQVQRTCPLCRFDVTTVPDVEQGRAAPCPTAPA